MGLYGDNTTKALAKRVGVVDEDLIFSAHFTTAGAGAPTIDTNKTRGVVSIARTGVGVFRITLPFKMRHTVISVTPFAYPAGAIVNGWSVAHTEGALVVDVTVNVLSTGAAGDTTGLALGVRIEGRAG